MSEESDKAAAKAVKDAVSALNSAVRAAAEIGLTVEIDHRSVAVVGRSVPWPELWSTVKRVRIVRY